MGFYGNITNTSKTQFVFDRKYRNRLEMDTKVASDGIFVGRYVLVEYDEDYSSDIHHRAYIDDNGYFYFTDSLEEANRITYDSSNTTTNYFNVVEGTIIYIVKTEGTGDSATQWFVYYNCTGKDSEGYATFTEITTINNDSNDGEENDSNTNAAINYVFNYNEDMAVYGKGRGYDSTVWQKTYVNNTEKYVMIAELNSVVPSFEISADAPSMTALTPHFDSSSTNVHYTLHTQPQWGVRTKAATSDIEGETFDKYGNEETGTINLTSDTKTYPSDQTTVWTGSFYNSQTDTRTDKKFFNPETNRWEDNENTSDSIDAAIYYNELGFDPEYNYKSSYWVENNTEDSWEGENNIDLLATGYSGKKYNTHLENHSEPETAIDTLELSMMLPALGDSISQIWDIVYGNEEQTELQDSETLDSITDEDLGEDAEKIRSYGKRFKRNLDIAWEQAETPEGDGPQRKGLRMVTENEDLEGFTYNELEQVNTVAGCINSVHDLMGMIITDMDTDLPEYSDDMSNDDKEKLSTKIKNNYNENYIYYFENQRNYYRKYKDYFEKEINYKYIPIAVDKESYNEFTYYKIDGQDLEGNDIYVRATGEYDETEVYYYKKSNKEIYTPITFEDYVIGKYYLLDPYNDYIVCTDKQRDLSQGELWNINIEKKDVNESFKSYTFYTKTSNNSYILSASTTPEVGVKYYQPQFKESIKGKCYAPNKYYIKNAQGQYILDTSETRNKDATYYNVVWIIKDIIIPKDYSPVELTEDTYVNNYYYIEADTATGYTIDSSNKFDANQKYYEGSNLKTVTQTSVDETNTKVVSLIDYEENKYYVLEEFLANGKSYYNYMLSDDKNGTDNVQYYSLENENQKDGFYVKNTYYYQLETVDDDGNTYYSYMLDTKDEKTEDRQYYLITDASLVRFYERGKYYYKTALGKYLLDSNLVKDNSKDYYEYIPQFVMEDLQDNYEVGANWTVTVIPNTIKICNHVDKWTLQELSQFARKLNTIHGLILKLNQILNFEDIDSRDSTTVQGVINILNDIIARFTEVTPGEIMMVDSYGRIHGAPQTTAQEYIAINNGTGETTTIESTEDRFINWDVNDNVENPQISIYHNFTQQDNTKTISDKNIPLDNFIEDGYYSYGINNTNDDTLNIYTPIVDNNGHVVGKNEEVITLPFGFKNLSIQNSQKSDETWSQSDGVAQSQDEPTGTIIADNTKDTLIFQGGNKWIRFKSSGDSNKTNSRSTGLDTDNILTFAHETHDVDTEARKTDLNDGTTDTITFQDIEFDIAGHVTENHDHTYTLPYGFKTIKVTNDATTVVDAASTIVEDGQIADNTQDTLTFSASNKWIKLDNNTEDTVKIGHEVHEFTSGTSNTQYGLAADETIATLDVDNTFEVPNFSFDEAGHITQAETHTVTLPENFTKVTVSAASEGVSDLTYAAGSIEADTLTDEMIITPSNKWIKMSVDSSNDTLTVGHEVHTITTDAKTASDINGNGDTITIQDLVFDEAGHVTANQNHTYTLPYGYKTFTGDSGNSTASNTQDSMAVTGDSWIQTTVEDDKIKFAHIGPVAGDQRNLSNLTPAFGSDFTIEDWVFDNKGHKTNVSTHTVTIPKGSLTDATANGADLITQLSFTDTTGALVTTRVNVGNLLLTGYSKGSASALTATDSLNTAIGKLEAKIDDEITNRTNAINDLDSTVTGTGNFVKTISETDGKVTATLGGIDVDDVPTLTLSKISDAGTMAAEDKDTYALAENNVYTTTTFAYDETNTAQTIAWLFAKVADLETRLKATEEAVATLDSELHPTT